MNRPHYTVIASSENVLLIKDNCELFECMSITNGAEIVIQELHEEFNCKDARIFYIDTENKVDELLHDGNGKFLAFKPGNFKSLEEFYSMQKTIECEFQMKERLN